MAARRLLAIEHFALLCMLITIHNNSLEQFLVNLRKYF
jgi:hypothetical protein